MMVLMRPSPPHDTLKWSTCVSELKGTKKHVLTTSTDKWRCLDGFDTAKGDGGGVGTGVKGADTREGGNGSDDETGA